MKTLQFPCEKPELFRYTPHQSKMLLLDRIEHAVLEKSEITTAVIIGESSEFLDERCRKMPVWVSFEYMAQSIAALSGVTHVRDGNKPKIGFIMGIRECRMERPWYEIGDTVIVGMELEFRDGDVAVFRGTASVEGDICCTAVLSVIESSDSLMEQFTGKAQ